MEEYTNKSYPEEFIDKRYCDDFDIRAEWFKLDRETAECLLDLVEESHDDKGNLVLKDSQFLAYSVYAILKYFIDGKVSDELLKVIQRKDMKLGKRAYKHSVEEIEEARVKVAKLRLNGQKGGRRSSHEKPN